MRRKGLSPQVEFRGRWPCSRAGIFPTQGSNPGLQHCRWILYQLSHKGSPRMGRVGSLSLLQGISRPRNQTGVSCVTGGFFTN